MIISLYIYRDRAKLRPVLSRAQIARCYVIETIVRIQTSLDQDRCRNKALHKKTICRFKVCFCNPDVFLSEPISNIEELSLALEIKCRHGFSIEVLQLRCSDSPASQRRENFFYLCFLLRREEADCFLPGEAKTQRASLASQPESKIDTRSGFNPLPSEYESIEYRV